ncbi:MAG: beta-Ala-His dipeptidase [Lachnospiraceae bacterium]|nr:beta-Ala-His dipeptidase [Lachnospiraceae bacterium]
MGVLDGLKPQPVFHYFEEMTRIPRGSGNTRAISDYLAGFARERGLETVQDEAGNVLVTVPASPGREQLVPLMLQGHMDMVAVRETDSPVDPARDPLILRVDGDLLYAEKTSLGGDDGIALAYFCALMEDRSLEHPVLYLLMTTDEETGMDGALALRPELLKAGYLINIDSEEEGVLLAGCAGGGRVHLSLSLPARREKGKCLDLRLAGLQGGHSGIEIVRERGNANLIAGRLLLALVDAGIPFAVRTFSGGTADNVIPSEACLSIVLPEGEQDGINKISSVIENFVKIIRTELGKKDPEFRVSTEESSCGASDAEWFCLTPEAAADVAGLLMTVPNGVQAMSADLAGLVETSLNLGVMRLVMPDETDREDEPASLQLDFSVRSSRESSRDLLIRKLRIIADRYGAASSVHGLYPGWAYDPESILCRHFAEAFEKVYGKKPRIEAIHAGVECGLFREKRPDLDCISLGPDLEHVHSTAECLHIASASRTWEYLKAALKSWDRT